MPIARHRTHTHRQGRLRTSCAVVAVLAAVATCIPALARQPSPGGSVRLLRRFDVRAIRLALEDLLASHGRKYPNGKQYLARLDKLCAARVAALKSIDSGSGPTPGVTDKLLSDLRRLRSEALLANPLLDFEKLLVLKRRKGQHGLPVNHKCNSGLKRTGYDNEIAVLSPAGPGGKLTTLYRPGRREYVGEIDLHFDADRMLFTMTKGPAWEIFEIKATGGHPRQVSKGNRGVDSFDACYLPDGRIVYASTASWHAVPCWHGQQRACAIYRMNADGSGVRQLCFDQDLDLHPSVMPSGQVVFSRWDYTGTMHMYLRPLMVMNPDGTGQRALYGTNSYWPNSLYFPRGISGAPTKVVAIVSGYHGVPRMGELVLIDLARGTRDADGIVQRIPGRGKPVKTIIRDKLVESSWPKFLHPYPLSDPSTGLGAGKYFLVAAQPSAKAPWGIYLADVFDNIIPLCVRGGVDLFEPVPLRKTPRPPAIPDKVDLTRDDAVCYVQDVHIGPGLTGVPRGTVKSLRIVAYHFGFPGLAGPDKIGSGGPWEVMRIVGTVPVYKDGSASFRIPAATPLSIQPLDAEGKAVQLMRSWFSAMPGETVSCIGCHEGAKDTPPPKRSIASARRAVPIQPWYGPARGLDFERDVQPALDKYCVGCHNGARRTDGRKIADLRSEGHVKGYRGRRLTKLGSGRLHPEVRKSLGGDHVRYTPAYEALLPFIRRVNIEDDVNLLPPGEYHADTSQLVQMLAKGHHNVKLDAEAWDRIVTWIDLNGPCHGTWGDVAPIPDGAAGRRRELSRLYGGPKVDPEAVPVLPRPDVKALMPDPPDKPPTPAPKVPDWPFDADRARRRQKAGGTTARTIDLGGGVTMKFVRIPAGTFVMGSADGPTDERPPWTATVRRDFWMGVCEVTNEQFRRFDPKFRSGYFNKRYAGMDGPGLDLGGANQPAVRVSWVQAEAFCKWLSKTTRQTFTLPTEVQWEYACRAGTDTDMSFGLAEADFSAWANVADKALQIPPPATGGLGSNITQYPVKGILMSAVVGGNIPCDGRFNDKAVATAPVGRYRPNAWALHDMHGNVAEWTRTTYQPYPLKGDSQRTDQTRSARKVVRGGSWVDTPKRCRSAFRLPYRPWQRVHNVGFRVVCQVKP